MSDQHVITLLRTLVEQHEEVLDRLKAIEAELAKVPKRGTPHKPKPDVGTDYPEWFQPFWAAAPRKEAKARSFEETAKAVDRIVARDRITPEFARAWLLQRWQVFVVSPKGQSFPFYLRTFCRDEHYDDDPEAWQVGTGKPQVRPAAGGEYSETAEDLGL